MCDVANLKIKPKKCKIVPLGDPTQVVAGKVSRWILANIPEWSAFEIADSAEYLGFWLGPGSNKHQWQGINKKMAKRFEQVKAANSSTTLSLLVYNSKNTDHTFT